MSEPRVVIHRPAELPDEDVAVLAVVLAAFGAASGPPAVSRRRERWGDPAELLRGPGGWASALRQA